MNKNNISFYLSPYHLFAPPARHRVPVCGSCSISPARSSANTGGTSQQDDIGSMCRPQTSLSSSLVIAMPMSQCQYGVGARLCRLADLQHRGVIPIANKLYSVDHAQALWLLSSLIILSLSTTWPTSTSCKLSFSLDASDQRALVDQCKGKSIVRRLSSHNAQLVPELEVRNREPTPFFKLGARQSWFGREPNRPDRPCSLTHVMTRSDSTASLDSPSPLQPAQQPTRPALPCRKGILHAG